MKEMEARTENRYEYRKLQEKRKQMIAPDLFEFAYVPDWYGHLAELKMAAYCRVSTDQEEQLLSYENQVNYYTITSVRIHSMNMQELMQTKVFQEPIPKRGMNSTV